MYTGGVNKKYGLDILLEGFVKANIPNSQLIIYPDQYADPESILSFSNPIVKKATEYTLYDRVSRWVSNLIRKSE